MRVSAKLLATIATTSLVLAACSTPSALPPTSTTQATPGSSTSTSTSVTSTTQPGITGWQTLPGTADYENGSVVLTGDDNGDLAAFAVLQAARSTVGKLLGQLPALLPILAALAYAYGRLAVDAFTGGSTRRQKLLG